jgi:hypothetical protein
VISFKGFKPRWAISVSSKHKRGNKPAFSKHFSLERVNLVGVVLKKREKKIRKERRSF